MTSLITRFTELVLCIDLLDCVLLILQRIGTFQQYRLKSNPMHDALRREHGKAFILTRLHYQ
jgi:hypothetical protein